MKYLLLVAFLVLGCTDVDTTTDDDSDAGIECQANALIINLALNTPVDDNYLAVEIRDRDRWIWFNRDRYDGELSVKPIGRWCFDGAIMLRVLDSKDVELGRCVIDDNYDDRNFAKYRVYENCTGIVDGFILDVNEIEKIGQE